ncbi:MAG: PEGA domain-containing protein [Planctomycetes bacterium]|nr:PEGA domain-containing protein [Planctomycetota bacterium]
MAIPILLLTLAATTTGCVRRTIRITSEPAGALVWLNHHEIGRTPVEVDFTHYGTYDLLIKKDGWEPMIGVVPMGFRIHGTPGLDLALEVLPIHTHSLVEWHVDMVPRDNDHSSLLNRAANMRTQAGGHDPDEMVGLDEHPNGTSPAQPLE